MELAHDVTQGMSVLSDMTQSKGGARDLTHPQISLLRKTFEDSNVGLYLFCQHIFGYYDLIFDLHLDMCRFLSNWGQCELSDGSIITRPPIEGDDVVDNDRRLMVCIPRECFKTSVATRGLSLWTLCRDPSHNPTFGIFNEKSENIEAWLSAICEVVESSYLFQVIWRDMLPRGISYWDKEAGRSMPRKWKWGGTGIRFVRDARGIPELSIEPHGIGGAATGKHFTHKILDDIIGEKAAQSPAIMQDAINWVDNSRPLERPAENGCELVVHTPWGYADVYAHMLKRWPGEYKVYKRHILEDKNGRPDPINGTSIFPTKISTDKAKGLLKTDNFVNYAQYMCIPKAGRTTSFSEDWLRFGDIVFSGTEPVFRIKEEDYDPELHDPEAATDDMPISHVPLSWMDLAILVDPIPGKPAELKQEPNCANGIAVAGKDSWGRRFLLETSRLHCTPVELFEEIARLAKLWSVTKCGIEEVAFSYVFRPLFELLKDKKDVPWLELHALMTEGRQKDTRIKMDLQFPIQTGLWYINSVGTQEGVQEVTEYPNCEWKDVIDAWAYADKLLEIPLTPARQVQQYYENRRMDRGLTGYGDFF